MWELAEYPQLPDVETGASHQGQVTALCMCEAGDLSSVSFLPLIGQS